MPVIPLRLTTAHGEARVTAADGREVGVMSLDLARVIVERANREDPAPAAAVEALLEPGDRVLTTAEVEAIAIRESALDWIVDSLSQAKRRALAAIHDNGDVFPSATTRSLRRDGLLDEREAFTALGAAVAARLADRG